MANKKETVPITGEGPSSKSKADKLEKSSDKIEKKNTTSEDSGKNKRGKV